MNDQIPRTDRDHVLIDVKAKPSGGPTASLEPDSGRDPRQGSGSGPAKPEIPGLYGLRGLPQVDITGARCACQRVPRPTIGPAAPG